MLFWKNFLKKLEGNNGIFLFAFVPILGLAYTVLKNKGSLWLFDLYAYWQSNAYAIRGYDLSDCLSGEIILDSVGKLSGGLTLPWARFFSNLIIPGYLPFNICKYYFYFVWIVLVICAFVLTIKKMKTFFNINKMEQIILTAVIFFSPFYWEDAINAGNIGGVLCVITYIAILILDTHPLLAAFSFAIICTKPQIGFIFLFMLFLLKKYKVLRNTVIILFLNFLAGEIYVSIKSYHGVSLVNLLYAIENTMTTWVTGEDRNWFYTYGLFDPLTCLGVNPLFISVLSALSGIIFVFIINVLIPDNISATGRTFFLGGATSLASVFWSYKTPCDEVIMICCSFVLIYVWCCSQKTVKDNILCFICLCCYNSKINRFWLYHMVNLPYKWSIFLESVLRIVAFLSIVYLARKNADRIENTTGMEIMVK